MYVCVCGGVSLAQLRMCPALVAQLMQGDSVGIGSLLVLAHIAPQQLCPCHPQEVLIACLSLCFFAACHLQTSITPIR